jgi:hypothetical protein
MIVDQNQSERLGRQMHPADLCDPYGRVLGRFIPDLSGYEGLEPPIDEEELQRIEREGGGRKLADILAGLQNRG